MHVFKICVLKNDNSDEFDAASALQSLHLSQLVVIARALVSSADPRKKVIRLWRSQKIEVVI